MGGEGEGEDLHDEESCSCNPGYSKVSMSSKCRNDSQGVLRQCA